MVIYCRKMMARKSLIVIIKMNKTLLFLSFAVQHKEEGGSGRTATSRRTESVDAKEEDSRRVGGGGRARRPRRYYE